MKRIFVIFLAITLVFALAACSNNGDDEISGPSGKPSASPSPAASNSPSPSASPSADVSPSPSPSASPSPSGDTTLSCTVDGQTVTFAASTTQLTGSGVEATFGLDTALFTRVEAEGRDLFVYNEDTDTSIEFRYLSGEDAADLAPSYLDDYLYADSLEFFGTMPFNDEADAEIIYATGTDFSCHAYLIGAYSGTVAIVLSYTEQTEADILPRMEAMIQSLHLY